MEPQYNTSNTTNNTTPLMQTDIHHECAICLDVGETPSLHYSTLTQDCSCNYYIHRSCLVDWINRKRPEQATCIMCHAPIKNIDDFIDQRHTTEFHPRQLRVQRLQMNNVNGEVQIIPINNDQLQELHQQAVHDYVVHNYEEQRVRQPQRIRCSDTRVIMMFMLLTFIMWYMLFDPIQ